MFYKGEESKHEVSNDSQIEENDFSDSMSEN